MATTFLLIRHASHDYLGKAIAGWLAGVHINARGREESARLAESLADACIEALYSSPLDRTMDTAEYIAGRLGLHIHVEEGFGEVRFGEWTGATFEDLDGDPRWEIYNRFRSGTRPPGGELFLEVQERTLRAMERIRDDHADGTVAIVTHGDVVKAAAMHYLGMPIDLLGRFDIAPASVTEIQVGDGWAKVMRLNAGIG